MVHSGSLGCEAHPEALEEERRGLAEDAGGAGSS